MFAPGWSVLLTKPFPTGSTAPIMTTGIFATVRLTAAIAGFHATTITQSAYRPFRPRALAGAYRHKPRSAEIGVQL